MRNFSKTLISMAAVMAVGSAMAAGAMAAVDFSSSIQYSGDKVTFSGVTPGMSQYTLLVVQGTEGTDGIEYIISDGSAQGTTCTIKQIDQDDTGEPFTEAVVGELAEGSYKIMVGNNKGEVDSGIFTVGGEDEKPGTEIILGNVNIIPVLEAGDYGSVLNKILNPNGTYQNAGKSITFKETKTFANGRTITSGTKSVCGNVNVIPVLDAGDYGAILNKILNPSGVYQLAGEKILAVIE